jgi:hypothetical protein
MQIACIIAALMVGQDGPSTTVEVRSNRQIVAAEPISDTVGSPAASSNNSTEWLTVGAEYLYGTVPGGRVPPLVTAGTGTSNAGILGRPGTGVLFGGDRLNDEARSGFRLVAGAWLDDNETCGVVGRFYRLCGTETNGLFGGDGQRPVGRPFFDAATGRPLTELVALAGVVRGSVYADSETGPLCGGDIAFRQLLCCGCNFRIDGLIGYRYLHFEDRIDVTENLATTDPRKTSTRFLVNDQFEATNNFHGLDLGFSARYESDAWTVSLLGRVSPGCVYRDVRIDGSTIVTVAGQTPVVHSGGLLALPSNIGRYETAEFAVVSELGIGVTYRFTSWARARIGYTCLYWPNVARAGDQIDLAVNPNLIPPPLPGGPARPAFTGKTDDLWMHVLSVGLEFSF